MGSSASRESAGSHGDGSAQPQTQYNVYNQPIDPTNNMPVTPNQLPWPGQARLLSTERVSSAIPKGGASPGSTWVFPSPQMFYNALMRKGKGEDVTEDDMDAVVAVHNGTSRRRVGGLRLWCVWRFLTRHAASPSSCPGMNEMTWQQVLGWENMHRHECGRPALLRFLGRPDALSPRARMRKLFTGACGWDGVVYM
jgi:cytochrome c heme-lyase